MLAVNISKSIVGKLDDRDPTDIHRLAEKWWSVSDDTVTGYADTLLAIAHNTVVGVYTVHGFHRDPENSNKVVFELTEAPEWQFLIDQDSPVTWTKGQANPVRRVDAATAADLQARRPAHQPADHGWSLEIAPDGRSATVRAPHGGLRITGLDETAVQLSTSES